MNSLSRSKKRAKEDGGSNKRMYYNNEHRAYLYGDGMFIADRKDLNMQGDIYLWRIIKNSMNGKCGLRKFVPIVIDGRECHRGVDSFLMIDHVDDAFYNKYQPVIVKMLADTAEIQIGMHYRIERSYPYLGYFQKTSHLFGHFKEYLFEMTKRAIIGSESRQGAETSLVLRPSTPSPVEIIDNYFQDLIQTIMSDQKWPNQTLVCVMSFPTLNLSRHGVVKSKGCEACSTLGREDTIGAYKLVFGGPLYDPITLKLDETKRPDEIAQPDFQFCYGCPVTLRSLHRMIHYKWWLYVNIRAQLVQMQAQLKPSQHYKGSDLMEHFMNDFEWVDKIFFEYQTIAIEGFLAKEKSRKMTNRPPPSSKLLGPKKNRGRPRVLSPTPRVKKNGSSRKSSIVVATEESGESTLVIPNETETAEQNIQCLADDDANLLTA